MFKPILAGGEDDLVSFPLAFQHGLGGRGLVPAGTGKAALVNDHPKTAIAQRNDLRSAPVVGVLTLIRVIRAGSFHGEEGGSFGLFSLGLGWADCSAALRELAARQSVRKSDFGI